MIFVTFHFFCNEVENKTNRNQTKNLTEPNPNRIHCQYAFWRADRVATVYE
jgi:hypothetical protein